MNEDHNIDLFGLPKKTAIKKIIYEFGGLEKKTGIVENTLF